MPRQPGKIYFRNIPAPDLRDFSQTFFRGFRPAQPQRNATVFWRARSFGFFPWARFFWLIAFFGLRVRYLIYIFGHELTHALWVWLMGDAFLSFQVGRDGGHVV